MNKYFLVAAVFAFFTLSAQADSPTKVTVVDKSGNLQIYTKGENGTYGIIPDSALQKILEEMMDKAKNITCGMKVAPTQVTLTVGPITATWTREDLCK